VDIDKWAGLDFFNVLKKIRDEKGLNLVYTGFGGVTSPKIIKNLEMQGRMW